MRLRMSIQFLHCLVKASENNFSFRSTHRLYSWQFSCLKSSFRNEVRQHWNDPSILANLIMAGRLFGLYNNSVHYLKIFFSLVIPWLLTTRSYPIRNKNTCKMIKMCPVYYIYIKLKIRKHFYHEKVLGKPTVTGLNWPSSLYNGRFLMFLLLQTLALLSTHIL